MQEAPAGGGPGGQPEAGRDWAKPERRGQVQRWHLRPGTTANSGEPAENKTNSKESCEGKGAPRAPPRWPGAGPTRRGRAETEALISSPSTSSKQDMSGLRQEERSPWVL